jgi:hypothetical protein
MVLMKFDDYLRLNDLTSAQFGALAGIPAKQTVHNYRRGIRFPSPDNLVRIREATKGAVKADDFVDQYSAQRTAAAPAGAKEPPKRTQRPAGQRRRPVAV